MAFNVIHFIYNIKIFYSMIPFMFYLTKELVDRGNLTATLQGWHHPRRRPMLGSGVPLCMAVDSSLWQRAA